MGNGEQRHQRWQEADRFGGDVVAKQMAADALEADDVSGCCLFVANGTGAALWWKSPLPALGGTSLPPARGAALGGHDVSEVFANVMSTQDVEVVFPEFGDFQLRLAGSEMSKSFVMQLNEREDGIDLDKRLMGASMMQLQVGSCSVIRPSEQSRLNLNPLTGVLLKGIP